MYILNIYIHISLYIYIIYIHTIVYILKNIGCKCPEYAGLLGPQLLVAWTSQLRRDERIEKYSG